MQPPEDFEALQPRVHTVKIDKEGDNIIHYAALPDETVSIDPVPYPEELAYNYSFELDEFQKCAVSCVHADQSILVSAHTSAGKTAIAIYAIALALKNNSRVVYTSPIKALSNQKYKELVDVFHDVGLMTGDTTINPSASCLVMTTEILRMMLFTGDALIRELSWVIYDEVHYMKDPIRGVVWEESIIMLPHQIHYVFLSATIPNAREFSEWIAQIHHQICHVVYTEHRPVPLRYFLSPIGDQKLFLVRNADGEINDENFASACAIAEMAASPGVGSSFNGTEVKNGQQPQKNKISKKILQNHTCQIVNQVFESNLYPMLIFVFSRKDCDKIHESLGEKSYNSSEEKSLVKTIFDNALALIDEDDRKLPQIDKIYHLAVRGIGIHHGGLMPVLKEVIEILFQHGLIKILFATETFAMGLNMPAKTVIFHDLYKFDGSERRLIASGEFIQMSGRAGRRNRDKFGAVIISYSGETPPLDLKSLMTVAAQPLNSEFRVTYNMLLNLLQTSGLDPKQLMKLSFHQFQMIKELPNLIKKHKLALESYEAIMLTNEEITQKAVKLAEEIEQLEEAKHKLFIEEAQKGTAITPGRIIKVKLFGWVTVAAGQQKKNDDIIIACSATETFDHRMVPTQPGVIEGHLIRVPFNDILEISQTKFDISFDNLSNDKVQKVVKSVNAKESVGFPIIDPASIVKFNKEMYFNILKDLDYKYSAKKSLGEIDNELISKYKMKRTYLEEAEILKRKIDSMQFLVNQKDLDSKKEVLKNFQYIDENSLVLEKGRVAASINAADELVMTEILLDGTFRELTEIETAAIATIFICDAETGESAEIPDNLVVSWNHIQEMIQKVANVSLEKGIDLDVEQFKRGFNPSFINLTIEWANGVSFAKVMEDHSSYYEGSIIRTMKRLYELLKQMETAAGVIGNQELREKFMNSAQIIQRGIVFAPSLYLEQ